VVRAIWFFPLALGHLHPARWLHPVGHPLRGPPLRLRAGLSRLDGAGAGVGSAALGRAWAAPSRPAQRVI
jgi:hypothetical protein